MSFQYFSTDDDNLFDKGNEKIEKDLQRTQRFIEALTVGLTEAFQTGKHSDVTIVVEERSFKCHKVILESMSAYFAAMFSSGMKECSQDTVHLRETDSQTFEKVITYMYSGCVEVTQDNVEAILITSSFLQIDTLQMLCSDFLIDNILENDTCLSLWRLGQQTGCQNLIQGSKEYITGKFEIFSEQSFFLEMTKAELIEIISDDCLFTDGEKSILISVVKWLQHSNIKKGKALFDILDHIRFDLISDEEWIDFLKTEKIGRALQCVLLKYRSQKKDVKSDLRRIDTYQDVLVTYVKDWNYNDGACEFFAYSLEEKKWYSLHLKDRIPCKVTTICDLGGDLYMAGDRYLGDTPRTGTFKFSGKTVIERVRKRVLLAETSFVQGETPALGLLLWERCCNNFLLL